MVNQRMLGLGTARSVIRELFEYGKQRSAVVGAENVFDFSLGNPSVPAPDAINETAIRILKEQPELIHCYTSAQGDAAARQRFADSLNRRFQGSYTADQFYITVGAAASLCCVFNGLTCPGDEFIVFAPYFPEYKVFIEGAGAKMVLIPPEIEHFQIDFDTLERSITPHTKGVVVNTPNNPSGVVYSRQTLEKLSAVLTAKSQEYGHPIYLISDEPYRELVYGGVEVPWIPDFYWNTIVGYSFSKSLSLPGERIGYLVLPTEMDDSEAIKNAANVATRILGYVNAPSFFQRVVARCLEEKADIAYYDRNRETLYEGLKKAGLSCIKPEGAFYLFVKSPVEDEKEFCEEAKKQNLLLVPGSSFACPGYVRLAYCVSYEMIVRSLPHFEELMKKYR